jgi:hypothetical protein
MEKLRNGHAGVVVSDTQRNAVGISGCAAKPGAIPQDGAWQTGDCAMCDIVIHEAGNIMTTLQGYVCDNLTMAASSEDDQLWIMRQGRSP